MADMKQAACKREIKPRLRFPEFREAGGWKPCELGPFLEEYSEKVPASTDLPIYSSTRTGLRLQKHYYDNRELSNEGEYGVVPAGYFVYRHMSDDGIFKFNINNSGERIAVSKEYPVFSVVEMHPDFLLHLLNEGDEFKTFAQAQKNGGTRTRLYLSVLRAYSVLLPFDGEQQKIADCLSSLDERIAAEANKLDTLKAYKRGLMQQLFPSEGETVPRLRFPEFRDAGEWEEKRLGDVCERIMDGTHFSPKSEAGPCLYLTSKNIQNGAIDISNVCYISEEEHRQIYGKCPVRKNDVLLTKDGANTGNCAINILDVEFSLLSSVAVLRGYPLLLEQRFLYQTIFSCKSQRVIKGSMSGQAITRVTLEKIRNFLISITSLPEQQKIADCLSSLDELITAQAQKIELLKRHKKGLMQQLFPVMDEPA